MTVSYVYPVVVQRGTDKLTVVIADPFKTTCQEIANIAAQQLDFPNYIANNASAILIFETGRRVFLLGGVSDNPALKDKLTKDRNPFPQQIGASIGGFLPNPNVPFIDAVMNSIKAKMFLTSDLSGKGLEAQQVLKDLCSKIESKEDWEDKVCVHTNRWMEDQAEKTMSVLTAVKRIQCKDSDLQNIQNALDNIMNIKKSETNPRILSEFKFVELNPIIENSIDSHLKEETEKASDAYDKFKDKIAVTFNDLAITTLAKSGAFSRYLQTQH